MTRYVYDDGTSDDTGYIIRAVAEDGRLLDEIEPLEIIAALRAADTGGPAATEEWSEWLEHHGGPCPLPPETRVECDTGDGCRTYAGEGVSARCWDWALDGGVPQAITRYRYRCLPGGWVERPDGWIPPTNAYPLMARTGDSGSGLELRSPPGNRDWYADVGVTHIRLLPRDEPAESVAPAMPAGWAIRDGTLVVGCMHTLNRTTFSIYGTATILAAVKAWCAAMEERR